MGFRTFFRQRIIPMLNNQSGTDKDILDPKTKSGAYVPIAKQILKDYNRLKEHKHWTAHARELDNTSLKKYLEQFRGKTKVPDWVIDLLELAYVNDT
jgi:hypothetical protein